MQLEYSGRMGYICDNNWDEIDAEVACRELGKDNSRNGYSTDPDGE